MEAGKSALRWGILGAARIAAKNWKAVRLSGNSVVRAVASRSEARSREFVDRQQALAPFDEVPEALGDYAALIDHPEVDAIYIPLPTALRKEWVIRAAKAGKHVLCEKPCAVNASDLREMLEACRKHGVHFMDGVMFMHNERMNRVRGVLDDPERIGPVRRIQSAFSFLGADGFRDSNIRAQTELEPLGCLGDLGWYCIRFALWVMRWQLPDRVAGRILTAVEDSSGKPGSPLEFSGELFFEGGVSCGYYCSFLANGQQWVTVSGEKGALRYADFVNPSDQLDVAYEVGHRRVMKEGSGMDLGTETSPHSQETEMFRTFANEVLTGSGNGGWARMAWKTQLVMDACFTSARKGNEVVIVDQGAC